MSLRAFLYRVSPKFIKRRHVERLKERLIDIESYRVPKRQIPHEVYLKALYDFSLALNLTLVKDFNHFRRVELTTHNKSSQVLAETVLTILDFKEIWRLSSFPDEPERKRTFNEFYANDESIDEIMANVPLLLIYNMLYYGDKTFKGSEADLALSHIDPNHLNLVKGRLAYQAIHDYVELLYVIIDSNMEALSGETSR